MAPTPHPIFTDREVAYIRRTPLSSASLASDFGVDVQTIRDIRNARFVQILRTGDHR